MKKDIDKIINIGVPCYSEVTLPVTDLTISCANNLSNSISLEKDVRHEILKRVNDVTNFASSNTHQDLFDHLNVFSDEKSIAKIDWSEKQKLIDLFWGLTDLDDTLSKEELLKVIDKQHELLHNYITYIGKNKYSTEFHNWLKKEVPNLYYGRPYGQDLRFYLNTENTFYTILKNHLDEVSKIDNSDLYEVYLDSLHTESVGLFIAYQTLHEVKEALKQGNHTLAQEKLFYLTSYFEIKDFMGLKVSIHHHPVLFETLKDEYEHLLLSYLNLKELNNKRSFFLNHDLEENKKVIETLLKMEKIRIREPFIKQGKTNDTKESGTRTVKPLSKVEQEMVQAYLDQKYYAYLKLNPKAQLSCPRKFSNYTAFLFENGMITADRFKGVYRLSETQSDAVYVFDAFNFEKYIRRNKQDLIRIVPRIMHRDGWREKVEEVAEKETSEQLKEEGKKLVKKINRF